MVVQDIPISDGVKGNLVGELVTLLAQAQLLGGLSQAPVGFQQFAPQVIVFL
jgi:hypothetical protein